MDIIGVIIAGIIIGLLGKFVAPGDKDNIPIWLTILCGIGGVLLGWYIYAAFGGGPGLGRGAGFGHGVVGNAGHGSCSVSHEKPGRLTPASGRRFRKGHHAPFAALWASAATNAPAPATKR